VVVALVQPAPEPTVVKRLEDMLERARTGEIVCVAVAGVLRGGGIATCWSAGDYFWPLTGALAHLTHRIHASALDEEE